MRAEFPRGVAALRGKNGGWAGSAVVIHSSAKHGTLALTNHHVAEEVARDGEAELYIPNVGAGTQACYLVRPHLPNAQALLMGAPMNSIDRFVEDLALLRVECEELLPTAALAFAEVGKNPQRFRVATIYPDGVGHVYSVEDPRDCFNPRSSALPRHGESGSGVFDEEGHLHGLLFGKCTADYYEWVEGLKEKLKTLEPGSKQHWLIERLIFLSRGAGGDPDATVVLQIPVGFVLVWLSSQGMDDLMAH